jgi:hypothetical protein
MGRNCDGRFATHNHSEEVDSSASPGAVQRKRGCFRENARSNAYVVDFYEEDNGCSLSVRLHKKITRKRSICYVIAKYLGIVHGRRAGTCARADVTSF